jgi:hypothetical protein
VDALAKNLISFSHVSQVLKYETDQRPLNLDSKHTNEYQKKLAQFFLLFLLVKGIKKAVKN